MRVPGAANGVIITLPDGSQLKSEDKMTQGQFIICQGHQAFLADRFRKKIAGLEMDRAAVLGKGKSTLGVRFQEASNLEKSRSQLTVWISGKGAEAVPF